jgi:hypothetical protein
MGILVMVKQVQPVSINVKLKTSDGLLLRGKINMDSDHCSMDRLSDLFIKGKNPFVALYDVEAQGDDNVIIINKAHIIWITPDNYRNKRG